MAPVVDRLIKDYAGKVEIRVLDTGKSDAEMERLATEYSIQYVPTFIFLNSDGSKAEMVVGETPEASMRAKLDALK
jgi:thiol-disulfide isomerase/thioredoxin